MTPQTADEKPRTAHGLSKRHIGIIRAILAPYADRIERVDLFGSMVLRGTLGEAAVATIRRLLDDSLLPYKIDLCAYDLIGAPKLRAHIDLVAKTLLTQADLRASQQDKSSNSTRTPP